MERDYTDSDYMQVLASDWKKIVCNENGNIILDKVARELRDYSLLMQCTSFVYDNICNVSHPFTDSDHILKAIDESIERRVEKLFEEKNQIKLERVTNPEWDYAKVYRELHSTLQKLIALLNYLAQKDSATMASIAAASVKLVVISTEVVKTHKNLESIAIDNCAN
ncbi:hypothetical protein NIES4071_102770 (plasmid) [Calothrix sp. NIES-4071]|nr:hypothetical protein NIES4071_102770 [Calothrix sp. NIES-4071]BAZ64658.1 hypothetical protein NIES4105_103910 [Calothrix sp. NIES-4105]